MPHATRCKYIAICANVFVICLSLSILFALYLFASFQTTSQSAAAPNSSRSLRQPGEENSQQQQQNSSSDSASSKPLFAYFINWLGQSVVSSSGEEVADATFLFTAGRPLIAVLLLFYLLAIITAIAIGLEHLTLLFTLLAIFAFIFASSLSALVFSALSTAFDSNFILFDFWNCLLIAICCVSALQIYTTAFLLYELFMERRIERSHEYCLAKMVPSVDVDEL